MNATIEAFARKQILVGLEKCTEAQQLIFKRFYSPTFLEAPIDKVVANMPVDRLDWALTQVERTLAKAKA